MAKKNAESGEGRAVVTLDSIDAVYRKQVLAQRRTVIGIARDYAGFREKAADVAPRLVKLFNQIKAALDTPFGLADFARLFDPSVPKGAGNPAQGVEGYRTHKVYYTLDYMVRTQRPRRTGQQGKRDPAGDQLARALATIIQIVKNRDVVWETVKAELRLGERLFKNLQNRVEKTKPLINLSAVMKPINVEASNVIHMEPLKREGAEETRAVVSPEVAKLAGGLDQAMRGGKRRVRLGGRSKAA